MGSLGSGASGVGIGDFRLDGWEDCSGGIVNFRWGIEEDFRWGI